MTFPALCASQACADSSLPSAGGRPQVRSSRSVHYMAAGAVFGLPLSGRASVTCHSGELWVTGPGTDDLIVRPGQTIGITGPGRIVVEALAESRFGIRQDTGGRAARSNVP